MILLSLLILGALFVVPYALTKYLFPSETQSPPVVKEAPPLKEPVTVQSSPFTLDEGYGFDLADGWELKSHNPDQNVDRYRFEKPGQTGIFTFSFYEGLDSFEKVVKRRYGDAFISKIEDFKIGNWDAQRISSGFDVTGSSSDVVVKIDDNHFLSLYGIYNPDGEEGAFLIQEIDFMQRSLKQS